jgi:hypothetical protein
MIEGPRVRHRHRRGVKHGARPYGAITSAVRATRKKIVKRESHQRYILCCCWGVMIYFVLLGGYEILWALLKLLMRGVQPPVVVGFHWEQYDIRMECTIMRPLLNAIHTQLLLRLCILPHPLPLPLLLFLPLRLVVPHDSTGLEPMSWLSPPHQTE